MSNYFDFVGEIQNWMLECAVPETADQRGWCTLGLDESLESASIVEHFSKDSINDSYQRVVDEADYTTPIAFWQLESDNLHSLSKMMAYRHQPRLKNYRDDYENKEIRTFSSISWSNAKLQFAQKNAQ